MYENQLNAMISALASGSYSPPANVAQAFKQQRIAAVSKALGLTNIFVPVVGHFPQANTNATFTVYTKPLQRDVIVLGCALMAADEREDNRLLGEFRLRLPEPLSHLSQNYIFPAMAFAPATYSVFFPAPFLLKASEQIAVDFGNNSPQAGLVGNTAPETDRLELVLFCTAVKNCLAGDDVEILKRAIQVINDTDYQRRVLLNSATQGSIAKSWLTGSPLFSGAGNMVVYPQQTVPATAIPRGSLTSSETRQADVPLLVVGLAINSCGEIIRITDTGSGHSFTQGEFVYAHSLWFPEEFTTFAERGPYYSYFRLPVPHVLRPGASLFTEHLAPGVDISEQRPFNPEYMVWECVTP